MAKEKVVVAKRSRLTLDLTPKQLAKLTELEGETGESKAEIVRNSLRLYTYIAERAFSGSKFFETDKHGNSKEIVVVELT
jgi:hypothetical protein